MNFPTPVTDNSITNFEKSNNIGVLVVGYDDDKYVPVKTPGGHYETIVNLFYFSDGERSHYACVKGISRLLSSSLSRHNQKVHICCHCLSSIPKDRLEEHVRFCSRHEPTRVTHKGVCVVLRITRIW